MTKQPMLRVTAAALLISLLTSACGTILYPERRGQTSGNIDPAIAVLDAAGLILFFVPGVIAFAVDFVTGAIYLPKGKQVMLNEQELQQIRSSKGEIDQQALSTLMQQKFPQQNTFDPAQLQARAVTDEKTLALLFKQPELLLSHR